MLFYPGAEILKDICLDVADELAVLFSDATFLERIEPRLNQLITRLDDWPVNIRLVEDLPQVCSH